MKHNTLLFALLFIGGVITNAIAVAQDHQHNMSDPKMEQTKEQAKEAYTCPMHPEVISDQPGKCPKCGMTLVKVKPSPGIQKSHKMQKDTSMSHPDKMH